MNINRGQIDYTLVVAVSILVTIGIIMVFSASSNLGLTKHDDPNFYLKKQAIRIMVGLLLMAIFSFTDYHILKRFAKLGLLVSIVLLLYLLIMEASSVKGATRWISLGGMTFQPSVMAQYAMILYMADAIERKQDKLNEFFDGYMPLLIVLCLVALLVLFEPDFSTTVIMTAVVFMMFFIGNIKLTHIGATVLASVPFFVLAVITTPYRIRRIFSFLNPEADPQGTGYQIKQSLIALGSGGLFGAGLGQSKQKLLYLPEPHTDFIYSIIGEELGFIGTIGILFLFVIILWRGLIITKHAPELFGRLLAAGITLSIVISAFVNIGVVCGALPTTGLPMPFISYGGSSMAITLGAVGILLNISRQKLDKPLKKQNGIS